MEEKRDTWAYVAAPALIHHRYVYNTTIGIENKQPQLTQHKSCNLVFALNLHEIRDAKTRQAILNTSMCGDINKPILLDISMVESILMTLNDVSKYSLDTVSDPYILFGNSLSDERTLDKKYKTQYNAIAPFREILLKNLFTENELYVDYEKSIPFDGPVSKFTKLIKPKGIVNCNVENCFHDTVGNKKLVTLLYEGKAVKDFALQLPVKRCFFTSGKFDKYRKIYLVVAPYNESIICGPIEPTTSHKMFSNLSITQLVFEDGKIVKNMLNPSYVLSYMFSPERWSMKAVISEVVERCKHYSQTSNLQTERFCQFAIISLGMLPIPCCVNDLKKKVIDQEEMFVLNDLAFHVTDWYIHNDLYQRNMTKNIPQLSHQIIEKDAIQKFVPKRSLPSQVYMSQQQESEFKYNLQLIEKLIKDNLDDGDELEKTLLDKLYIQSKNRSALYNQLDVSHIIQEIKKHEYLGNCLLVSNSSDAELMEVSNSLPDAGLIEVQTDFEGKKHIEYKIQLKSHEDAALSNLLEQSNPHKYFNQIMQQDLNLVNLHDIETQSSEQCKEMISKLQNDLDQFYAKLEILEKDLQIITELTNSLALSSPEYVDLPEIHDKIENKLEFTSSIAKQLTVIKSCFENERDRKETLQKKVVKQLQKNIDKDDIIHQNKGSQERQEINENDDKNNESDSHLNLPPLLPPEPSIIFETQKDTSFTDSESEHEEYNRNLNKELMSTEIPSAEITLAQIPTTITTSKLDKLENQKKVKKHKKPQQHRTSSVSPNRNKERKTSRSSSAKAAQHSHALEH